MTFTLKFDTFSRNLYFVDAEDTVVRSLRLEQLTKAIEADPAYARNLVYKLQKSFNQLTSFTQLRARATVPSVISEDHMTCAIYAFLERLALLDALSTIFTKDSLPCLQRQLSCNPSVQTVDDLITAVVQFTLSPVDTPAQLATQSLVRVLRDNATFTPIAKHGLYLTETAPNS